MAQVRRAMYAVLSAIVLSLGLTGAATRQARAEIDAIFAEWNREDSPGCALALYDAGRIVYERGYGMASLEHDVPITPETVFYLGSVSKQFTAMAAALAIDEGRLSPDDAIRKYLPELPPYADAINVRHLVHHTSGLRDYNTLLSIAGRRGDEAFDNATVLRIAARQTALNFEPGTEYLYSNTGYTLLATIVERATEVPFAKYAQDRIFKPLGMRVTHFHTDQSALVKWRAFAYGRNAQGFMLDTPSNERAGAGGVYSSVRDLLAWDANFYGARVGGRSLVEKLQQPGVLKDGSPLTYAWGLQVGTYRGLRIVEHSGSLGGYRAHLTRFPDQHVSVVALCNLGSITPGTLVRQVADAHLAKQFTAPRAENRSPSGTGGGRQATPAAPDGGTVDLSGLAGRYHGPEVDATFTIAVSDGRATLARDNGEDPSALQPVGIDRFRFRGMTITVERDAGRRAAALVVDAGRVRGIRFTRLDPRPPGTR